MLELWCSEIERQNLQTAASDELTGVCHSKRQQVCCISRQNSRCLCESSSRPWLDKKQVVSQTNERNEMWQWSCVNWIPFIATSKERKKQEVMSKMAYLKVQNECKCVLRVECWNYRKKTPKHECPWGCNLWVTRLVSGRMMFVTYANFGQPELV